MVSRERKALLRSGVLPLILGNGIAAHLLSFRLFRRYGLSSVICSERKELLSYLNFKCGFLQLSDLKNHRLAKEQLIDFADDKDELTLLILPCNEKARRFTHENSQELESRYILLCDEHELYSHPLFASQDTPNIKE